MVGERLQKYIAGWGLEARDVPTVITTFLGSSYMISTPADIHYDYITLTHTYIYIYYADIHLNT